MWNPFRFAYKKESVIPSTTCKSSKNQPMAVAFEGKARKQGGSIVITIPAQKAKSIKIGKKYHVSVLT